MTRIPFVLLLATGLGCTHIQPVGPLADSFGGSRPAATKPAEEPDVEPVVKQATRPPVPAVYVTPGEVTPITATEAAKRLQQELETDRRAAEAMPRQ